MNLLIVFERLGLMLANQRVELNKEQESQKFKRAHRHCNVPCMRSLVGKVSLFALDKILDQYQQIDPKQIDDSSVPCLGQFKKTYGLPCKHHISQCLINKTAIALDTVHPQWLLNENPFDGSGIDVTDSSPLETFVHKIAQLVHSGDPQVGSLVARLSNVIENPHSTVRDPVIVTKTRGRPPGAKNKNTSTKRDPSRFEYVEKRKRGRPKGAKNKINEFPLTARELLQE
jgi:hypothetical protein